MTPRTARLRRSGITGDAQTATPPALVMIGGDLVSTVALEQLPAGPTPPRSSRTAARRRPPATASPAWRSGGSSPRSASTGATPTSGGCAGE